MASLHSMSNCCQFIGIIPFFFLSFWLSLCLFLASGASLDRLFNGTILPNLKALEVQNGTSLYNFTIAGFLKFINFKSLNRLSVYFNVSGFKRSLNICGLILGIGRNSFASLILFDLLQCFILVDSFNSLLGNL